MHGRLRLTAEMALALASLLATGDAGAQPCSPWQRTHPVRDRLALEEVFAARGKLVAYQPYDLYMTSQAGRTWATHKAWSAVAFTPKLVVGDVLYGVSGPAIATSSDGLAWTVRLQASTGGAEWESLDFVDIAWNGSLFVALAVHAVYFPTHWWGETFTSPDGRTWTQAGTIQNPGWYDLRAIGWAGRRFVAVGGWVATSTDGVTWEEESGIAGFDIAGNGRSAVIAAGSEVRWSEDGRSWETISLPPGAEASRVAWAGERFYALGTAGEVLSSPDGRTWAAHLLGTEDRVSAIVQDGGVLVAVGSNIFTSAGEGSWAPVLAPLARLGLYNAATWAGSAVVAVGWDGAIGVSPDAFTWEQPASPTSAALSDVAWTGTQLVAVGDRGTVLTSPDGRLWHARSSGTTAHLASVAWDGSRLLVVGWDRTVLTSQDGTSWQPVTLPSSLDGKCPWVAAGGDGRMVVSLSACGDLAGWTLASTADLASWAVTAVDRPTRRLYRGGGHFLVADEGGALASTDGVSWSPTSPAVVLAHVVWAGSRFLGWGQAGAESGMWSSPDGITWRAEVGPGPPWYAVWAGGQLVDVGYDYAARSACGQPDEEAWLPGAANLRGINGTRWRTDVQLHNPGARLATLGLWALARADSAQPWRTQAVTAVAVRPGASLSLENVLDATFGWEAAATLRLVSWDGPLEAAARTYNDAPSGTFGQGIPAQPTSRAAGTGEEVRLVQLSQAAGRAGGYRTNLGLVNVAAVPVEVAVQLYRADGQLAGATSYGLAPSGSLQVNEVFLALGAEAVEDGYAVLRTAYGRFLAHASVVDNRSGDPDLVTPVAEAGGGEDLYLPSAASQPGLASSRWKTDVELHNPGAGQAAVRVALLGWGKENLDPPVRDLTVEPGQALALHDVVAGLFGSHGGATLRVSVVSGQLMARARTYNDASAGHYGQGIAGLSASSGCGAGVVCRLVGLSHSRSEGAGFRTNLGLASASPLPIAVELTLHDAAGSVLGKRTVSLRGFESTQLNGIFATVTAGAVDGGFATVRCLTDGGVVLAYASVIDNRSNDPTYIAARPVRVDQEGRIAVSSLPAGA